MDGEEGTDKGWGGEIERERKGRGTCLVGEDDGADHAGAEVAVLVCGDEVCRCHCCGLSGDNVGSGIEFGDIGSRRYSTANGLARSNVAGMWLKI